MTTLQQMQAFAQALEPLRKSAKLQFACLHAERDLELRPRFAVGPYLHLTLLAEELACGHLVQTAEGRSTFIRVRTPFAASSTLVFVILRTYSLVLLDSRSFAASAYERDLDPRPDEKDLLGILGQAADAVTQAQNPDQDFIQPEHLGPLQLKDTGILAYRATFCSGSIVGTVLPSPSPADKGEAVQPTEIYLL